MAALIPLLALSLLGCTDGGGGTEGVADYELVITPVVAYDQTDLFDSLTTLDLVISPATGTPTRLTLDAVGSGATSELSELPGYDAATLRLEGFNAGGDLIAWGTSEPVDLASDELEISIFVGRVDQFNTLDSMNEGAFLAALTATAPGEWLLSGGYTDDATDYRDTTDRVDALSLVPADAGLGFEKTGVVLPALSGDSDGRVGHAMTTMKNGGHDLVGATLVTGGAEYVYYSSTDGLGFDVSVVVSYNSAVIVREGPLDYTIEEMSDSASMINARALHSAIEDVQGNVAIIGGSGSSSSGYWVSQGEVEFYEPDVGTFDDPSVEYDIERYFHASATAGANGTLTCGGLDFDYGGSGVGVADDCYLVGTDKDLAQIEGPNGALAHAAMTTLQDGRVMLTGGLRISAGSVSNPWEVEQDATDTAYLWNGSAWSATTAMNTARAMHTMVTLPDGRVLVVGGTTTTVDSNYGMFYGSDSAIACAEVFDPAALTWSVIGNCDVSSGTGVLSDPVIYPLVAVDDAYGALIVGGLTPDSTASKQVKMFVAPAQD